MQRSSDAVDSYEGRSPVHRCVWLAVRPGCGPAEGHEPRSKEAPHRRFHVPPRRFPIWDSRFATRWRRRPLRRRPGQWGFAGEVFPPGRRSRAASLAGSARDKAVEPLVSRRVSTAPGRALQLAAAIPHSVVPALAEFAKNQPSAGPTRPCIPRMTVTSNHRCSCIHSSASSGAGTRAESVNRMAVIVSPDGSVERVQLVDGPTRMPDMMLLSGAKTWRFSPAIKDGEPVRYRTVLTWSGLP